MAHRSYAVAPSSSVSGADDGAEPHTEDEPSAEDSLARAAIRTYRGPGQAVTMPNVTSVRAAVGNHGAASVGV